MYDIRPPSVDWSMVTPVVLVFLTGLAGLLIEMFRPKQNNNSIVLTSLGGLAASFFVLYGQLSAEAGETLAGMVLRDRFGILLQMALVGVCFISILFSEGYLREKRIPFGEFYPLAIWSTMGGMLMVASNSLLMIFIGLEVLSISLYVLAGLSRAEQKSEESALKYLLLGSFASAFLLYGIAFVYGASGSVHLSGVVKAWATNHANTQHMLLFGMGMMLVGFGFKSALAPFHQWTPDVYQGAPTNVTGFMAAGSKIAAIGALFRVLSESVELSQAWLPALFWVAILTMVVGNFAALVQKDVKRILGYSSISNAGYILAAILAHVKAPDKIGANTIVFYLFSYAVMTLGVFAVISMNAKDGREGTRLSDLNGLWKRSPLAGGVLIVCLASLIGIPLTGGFFGKFMIFQDLLTADMTPLAIVLAVTSVVSVYYYLGIAHAAWVAEEGATPAESAPMNAGLQVACVTCLVGVFVMGIFGQPVLNMIGGIVR
ncbi:MAG: NADH-quinone oxidoreductase subunit N [Armatimonadetes bacterium]|nr:NADH-quinone oxidoreductase subunit N [Armatimonadota bacterium]